jgi:hypothetical protein
MSRKEPLAANKSQNDLAAALTAIGSAHPILQQIICLAWASYNAYAAENGWPVFPPPAFCAVPALAKANRRRRHGLAQPLSQHKRDKMAKHVTKAAPAEIWATGVPVSFFLNDVDGDCCTAEECANIAEQFGEDIDDAEVKKWARRNGFLNGAVPEEVIEALQEANADPLIGPSGTKYYDGAPENVDWTDPKAMSSAINSGAATGKKPYAAVKMTVAAAQLNATYDAGSQFAIGYQPDDDFDHCTGICGCGTAGGYAAAFSVTLPAGLDPATPGYQMFSWDGFRFIDQPSLNNICCGATVRAPSSVTRA